MREELASLAHDLRHYLEVVGGVERRDVVKPRPKASRVVTSVRSLDTLREEVLGCTRCALHKTRRNAVFGEGNPDADIVFIGEAPGHDEDVQGRPFVGRAGQLLTKIIESIGLKREDVFIGNVLKCRPPGNRDPSPEESVACMPFLQEQIQLIRPKIICALGRIAASILLGGGRSLSSMRGTLHDWGPGGEVKLIATYHPAACLRNVEYKRPVWEDMKRLRDEYRAMGGRI